MNTRHTLRGLIIVRTFVVLHPLTTTSYSSMQTQPELFAKLLSHLKPELSRLINCLKVTTSQNVC